ncbi:tetratricopeptide repeat protein [Larkinella sp. VNQ87]|uniref:tetratricopeptide repeat protein n=1 Tax=Larkinella sp. VNQ87 TaxID=3400921 RepID=UPI003C0F7587
MNNRTKGLRLLGLLLCFPLGVLAQAGQLVSSARKVEVGKGDTVVEVSKTTARTVINPFVAPLFGEQAKSTDHIAWEVRFLSECDQNFNNRTEASQFFSTRAWEYLTEGQLDTASYRFNLAWLLDDKNSDSYWGLGVICYQQGNNAESIRLLKKGLEVADTNAVLMTDLATVELKQYRENKDNELLEDAIQVLTKALKYDMTNPNTFMRLSWANYAKGDYAAAWDNLHKARLLELSAVDLPYLQELLEKAPDPKGFFKR